MAEIAKPTITPTIGSLLLPHNSRLGGLYCGEDLQPFDAVYIKSDGKVWRATGAAANAAARVRGFSATHCRVAQNDPVTIIKDTEVAWANTLTPGIDLFLSSATVGGLTDTATTGGTTPIAFVKDAFHLVLLPTS